MMENDVENKSCLCKGSSSFQSYFTLLIETQCANTDDAWILALMNTLQKS